MVYTLAQEYHPFWIAGARVKWEHPGTDADILTTLVSTWHGEGYGSIEAYLTDWAVRGKEVDADPYYNYRAKREFKGSEIITDLYPTTRTRDQETYIYYQAVKYIAFYNHGNSDSSDELRIRSIEPILRPFEVHLQPVSCRFLQADGTYKEEIISCDLKDNVAGTVVGFLDDSITVQQTQTNKLLRYAQLTGLVGATTEEPRWIVRLAATETGHGDSSTSLSFRLTKELLKLLAYTSGSFVESFPVNYEMINANKANAQFYNDSWSWNKPTYGKIYVTPQFEYIDAKVTLTNPYSFLTCIRVNNKDYWIAPHKSVQIPDLHLGDTLAVSSVQPQVSLQSNYVGTGIKFNYRFNDGTTALTPATRSFSNDNVIYVGAGDDRLNFKEVEIMPMFTDMKSQGILRVKTADLDRFELTGALEESNRIGVTGEYTDYKFTEVGKVVYGKTYPLAVVPKDDHDVCIWTVANGRKYVGNSLMFPGGELGVSGSNTVVLSVEPGVSELALTGTLRYVSYSMSTQTAGASSSVPAEGAVVLAGSMSGLSDERGKFTTTSMRIPAKPQNYDGPGEEPVFSGALLEKC